MPELMWYNEGNEIITKGSKMEQFEIKKIVNALSFAEKLVELHGNFTTFRELTIAFKNSVLLTIDMSPAEFKQSPLFSDISIKVNKVLDIVYNQDVLSDQSDYIYNVAKDLTAYVKKLNVNNYRINDDHAQFNSHEENMILIDNLIYCIQLHVSSLICKQ